MAKTKPVANVRPKTPVLTGAERVITARLDEMLTFESSVYDPEAVSELHQMRIAAKRVRYTLELFQEAYDSSGMGGQPIRDAIAWAEQLQENLGAIHDADVLVPQLTARLAELIKNGYGKDDRGQPVVGTHHVDYEGCLGLIAVCKQLCAERDRRYSQFVEQWQKLRADDAVDALRARLREAADETSTSSTSDTPNRQGLNREPTNASQSSRPRRRDMRQGQRRQSTRKTALR